MTKSITPIILGVTGTNGAGKGTVVDYLVEKHGFLHYSAREFLLDEIRRRGMPEDRNSLREVANDLRKTHHPAYVIEQLFLRAQEKGGNAVIESIRAIGEANFLKESGARILAVDADKNIRYERIVSRGSITDKVSFEEFTIQEDRELHATDPWDMNVFGVMSVADFILTNNGNVEDLYAQVDDLPIFS